jgi:hypothetical protein
MKFGSQSVFFDTGGRDADPAEHGMDGADGEDGGRGASKNGCPGTDAKSTTQGEAGGRLTIRLATDCTASGQYYVRLTAKAKSMSTKRRMIDDDNGEKVVLLKELGSVDWSARGGRGCDGGTGGNGGPGGYSGVYVAGGSSGGGGRGTYILYSDSGAPIPHPSF